MGKKIVNYNLMYLNNSDAIMLFWNTPGENNVYKVYLGSKDGEFKLAGTVQTNYFITDAGNTEKAYIESYTKDGKYISTSQTISLEINSDEEMKLTAVRSYNGVTITWPEKEYIGNYFVAVKKDGSYIMTCGTAMSYITLNDINKGDSVRIISCRSEDGKATPVNISSEFVYSQDNFDHTGSGSPKVSVIIPIYNNEKFMVRCIDTVLASSLKEAEVIIVDDGSTDDSGKIADWYGDNYPGKVIVIHTENHGAAHARNVGIEAAKGEYIAFADSDDFIRPEMYEKLYEKAVKYNCDISLCSYLILIGNKVYGHIFPFEETGAYDSDWLLSMTYSKDYKTVAMWNKIYRAELVKTHPLPEIKKEDNAWSPIIYSHARNFCYVNDTLYCYDRTLTDEKSTLTMDYGKLPPLEYANECILAFDTMLAEGDPSKKELLMQICVRMLIKPVLDKCAKEGVAKFIEFLLVHKEEILSNKYIAEDKGLSDALNNIYSRSGFDENGNVVYNN